MTKPIHLLALILVLAALAPHPVAAKKKKPNPEEGMVLEVSTKQKKNKADEMTQTLPPAKEAPAAVVADTDRLFFQVSPLSSKGLMSQQTRDAMRALLRSPHGTNIVKLRAFVAGSGDMRRILEIAGEVFAEKHLPLPAIATVQAGALGLDGAQVVIESIGMDRKSLNPNGLSFIAGQPADSLAASLAKLKAAATAASLDPTGIVKLTCFVSALDPADRAQAESAFPAAAVNIVQMQRLPVTPNAACEAVGRRTATNPATPTYPQIAIVTAPKLVLTSMQMAFGREESDLKLALDRLAKVLTTFNSGIDRLVMANIYLTSPDMGAKFSAVSKNVYPATTLLPFEGLPSLDAAFALDVVAIPHP